MRTTSSQTVPTDTTKRDRGGQALDECGSGCICVCEEPCCELECLERPRFFCGQLLTNQDLEALVDWTRSRLALSRYVDGWGVACGLHVNCSSEGGARVDVEPGYAVDCCGNDIVVCKAASLDLSAACRDEEDPCADLGKLGLDKHRQEARRIVVDVGIRYAESGAEPQAALAQGSCGQVSTCEFTRTREGHELFWSLVEGEESPGDAAAKRWLEAWECCCEVATGFLDAFERPLRQPLTPELARRIRQWLLRWIAEHPPRHFCILEELLCRDEDDLERLLRRLPAILFLLVQECRNELTRCRCASCAPSDGVPLARVCLVARGATCRVVSIDPYPPFRRPLARDCCPAPAGAINTACVIWHRQEEACRELTARGLRVRTPRRPVDWPTSFEELRELCTLFKQPPLAHCGDEVGLVLVKPPEELCLDGTPRVVMVLSAAISPGPPAVEQPTNDLLESLKDKYARPENRPGHEGSPGPPGDTPPPAAPPVVHEVIDVDGIGKSRAATLRKHGITSITKLARTDPEKLQKIFPRVSPKVQLDWLRQARKLEEDA